jgi:hypothetical protein
VQLLMEALLEMKKEGVISSHRSWMGWVPLCIFTALAISLRGWLPPWELMWILSIAIFAGFKWWTWWRAISNGVQATTTRCFACLFLWPGMDARRFLALNPFNKRPTPANWVWAFTKTLFGAGLVWGVARLAGHGLLAGWIGMVGFIFLLHFGLFAALALFWQRLEIYAPQLMNCPITAHSLGDFWGKRWNSGFRDIVFGLMFIRLAKRFGTTSAAIITFVISGLIHEIVITFPAGAGYGLPTLYFTIQGVAMLVERSNKGARLGLAHGWQGHTFALVVVTLPIFALFPPPFVLGVMVPFFQVIKALP